MAGTPAGLLQRLFDRAPDGMIVTRLRGTRIVLVNEAFSRLLGYPPEEIVGRRAEDFGLWPERTERSDVRRRLMAEGRLPPTEAQLRTRGGDTLDIEVSAELLEIEGVPHAFAITRDISQRKKAERALRASEERFRTLIHSSRDAILVTDATGTITFASPGIEHILGYAPEEMVGTRERDFLHRDDLHTRDTVVKRLISSKEPHPPAELRMRDRDGSWRWLETIDTNRLDDPVIKGIVTNARDITERKATDETFAFRALHDPLTGLPNRRLLEDRIEHALARVKRTNKTVAVLFCDLDRFKEVNDSLGHDAGDELLRIMARRLRSILRPNDSLARLGGDEFVVVCSDLANVERAVSVAQRIATAVRAPFVFPEARPT